MPSSRLAVDQYGLTISGLMCIPPLDEAPAPHFALTAKIAGRNGLKLLSMGMSADFAIAVRFGATHVRVGSAIFGHRAPTDRSRESLFAKFLGLNRPSRRRRVAGGIATQPAVGAKPCPGDMDEHRAAAACNAWSRVVIDLDDEVVEIICAPQTIARPARGAA